MFAFPFGTTLISSSGQKTSYTVIGYYGTFDDASACHLIFRLLLPDRITPGIPSFRIGRSSAFIKRLGRYRGNGVGRYQGENGEGVRVMSIQLPYAVHVEKLLVEHFQNPESDTFGDRDSICTFISTEL